MSNFYLCDICARGVHGKNGYFACIAPGMGNVCATNRKVASDGRQPLDVCRLYKAKEDKR